MKVRIHVVREIEVEVSNPAIAELDNYWRTPDWQGDSPSDDLVEDAIKAIENATGLSFGYDGASETISAVYAMDGEPILEW